jgi:hypothetical protein
MVPSSRIFVTVIEKVATTGKKHARALLLLAFKFQQDVESPLHGRVLCYRVVDR